MSGLFEDLPTNPPAAGAPLLTAEPYRVLARKYRPRSFADLIGQEAMVRTLRNGFAMGRIAHGFMLTGVRGVGKTTTARIIARALNCIGADGQGGPTAEPCGVCANCRAILADRHPDVVEMDAASRTGVDDVREIIEATRYRPLEARRKIFIVDEVHMLSRNAFNAILKTLEEPPPHVGFIFATTEIRKVPVTVLSRCQRFDLRRLSIAELSAHFARISAAEAVPIDAEALGLIARAADGSVRDGLSLLDQAMALAAGPIDGPMVAAMLGLADRTRLFDLAAAVLRGRPAEALAITDRMHEQGADLGLVLADLLDLVNILTRLKTLPELRHAPDLPEAERSLGAALADALTIPALGRAWQMLLKGVGEVEHAPDRRAAAEMVLIRLCHLAEGPTPGEILRRLAALPPEPAPDPRPAPEPRGGGARAANGPDAAPAAAPLPQRFRDVAALAAARREAMLHAHLVHSVHLVRFAPPVIELRPDPAAPRDLAPRLAEMLLAATGRRWTVALSSEPGAPTLAAQGEAADAERRLRAFRHPLVAAILEAFPGARVEAVHETGADAYGLPPEAPDAAGPGQPEFDPEEDA